jgi:hypothetical protein
MIRDEEPMCPPTKGTMMMSDNQEDDELPVIPPFESQDEGFSVRELPLDQSALSKHIQALRSARKKP